MKDDCSSGSFSYRCVAQCRIHSREYIYIIYNIYLYKKKEKVYIAYTERKIHICVLCSIIYINFTIIM